MGTFRVTIEVGDPAGSSYREVSALVDTGASYSQIPDSILRDIGVVPDSRRTFRVADGREVERGVGETRVRLNGSSRMTVVVFGAEGSEAVLGAVTLEGLGLAVDPLNRRLIPVPGLLMVAYSPPQ
ncbi:MAG: aspartyl protease family protein [Chloroflexi bacterium]|nr:aspartyl protease family protein [Chloroflexota bacterium]